MERSRAAARWLAEHPGAFQNAMESAFYGPLGRAHRPAENRWFATAERLPHYAERIGELKAQGAELDVIFGIGRVCHIAFWEPHFADEFASLAEWKAQTHRLGRRLHPLTIEQNALTSFKSRTTLVPAFANTIGPGLFLQADRIDRRRRGRLRPRHAVAGSQPVDDPALRPGPVGSQLVHAHASRPALLPPRAGRPARARDELAWINFNTCHDGSTLADLRQVVAIGIGGFSKPVSLRSTGFVRGDPRCVDRTAFLPEPEPAREGIVVVAGPGVRRQFLELLDVAPTDDHIGGL